MVDGWAYKANDFDFGKNGVCISMSQVWLGLRDKGKIMKNSICQDQTTQYICLEMCIRSSNCEARLPRGVQESYRG